jgi:lipoprotein-releasing system permease protein
MAMGAIFGRIAQRVGFAPFIARRIIRGQRSERQGFSRPIVVIAVLGIVVGMAVMILTVGITRGFQREVRAKVTGAAAHLQITAIGQTDPKETLRIPIDQSFYPWLDTVPGIAHIQVYATRPGIIETESDIEGVVLKGIGADYDTRFLREHLLAGELPAIGDTTRPIDLLLSKHHADRLRIGSGDTITTYLVRGRDEIRPRRFRVCGVYQTGLEQIDHNLVFVDIDHLQRFAQWGLKAELLIELDDDRRATVEALAFGGDRIYTYQWPGSGLQGKGPHAIALTPGRDTAITLVVSDADSTVPDTAWARIDGRSIARGGSGGSYRNYCGGFEVILDRFADVQHFDDLVYTKYLPANLRSLSVRDRFPEIFAWLELLDKNVVVIIALMVIVAIINMTSALLIIILERTTMIGTLKALGASNGAIRRIFLIDAAYILGAGIVLGDLLGILLAFAQQRFGLVKLPVETYYVDRVIVDLELLPILALNAGTLGICVLALIVPSMLVTRIAPAKAIRFA